MTAQPQHAVATAPTPLPTVRKYKPDVLLYLTVGFMWMNVWRFQELLSVLGKAKISLVFEIALVIALLTQTSSRVRNWSWPKSKTFAVPFLLILVMVIGLPTNLWRGQGFTFITKDYAPTLLMFASLAVGVRERDDLDWVAFAHLIGAAFYSAWVFKFVSIGSDGRLGGMTYYDANDYGVLLVCALPFAIYFARPGLSAAKRAFAIASLALFVLMIVKSGSRGAFLGFIAVVVFVLLKYHAIPKRTRYGATVAAVALLGLFGSDRYWTMMRSILHPDDDYNTTSDVGRKAVWKRGVGYMLANPVLGVGAAAFPQAEGMLSETAKQFAAAGRGLKWSTAHNAFVLVGAEEGVTGIVLFIAMLWLLLRQLSLVLPPPRGSPLVLPADAAFAQALMISVVGFCVAGFFVSAAYSPGLYVIAGLGVAQIAILRRRAKATPAMRVPHPGQPHMKLVPRRRVIRPTWTPAA